MVFLCYVLYTCVSRYVRHYLLGVSSRFFNNGGEDNQQWDSPPSSGYEDVNSPNQDDEAGSEKKKKQPELEGRYVREAALRPTTNRDDQREAHRSVR